MNNGLTDSSSRAEVYWSEVAKMFGTSYVAIIIVAVAVLGVVYLAIRSRYGCNLRIGFRGVELDLRPPTTSLRKTAKCVSARDIDQVNQAPTDEVNPAATPVSQGFHGVTR